MKNHRRLAAALAVAAATTLLSACGGDHRTATADEPGSTGSTEVSGSHDDHEAATQAAEGARRIDVTATVRAFDPAEITADAGEELAVVLASDDMLHDFTIDELDAHVAADRGETAEGGLRADEPGTYTYYCSVPGHREAGMEGTLTVTG